MSVMAWTQADLARELACNPQTVNNWLLRNSALDPHLAFALQDKHRWNARWLIEGVGPARIDAVDGEAEALFRDIMALPAERRRALRVILGSR